MTKSSTEFFAASRELATAAGAIQKAQLQLGTSVYTVRLVVTANVTCDLLLGMDVLKAENAEEQGLLIQKHLVQRPLPSGRGSSAAFPRVQGHQRFLEWRQ